VEPLKQWRDRLFTAVFSTRVDTGLLIKAPPQGLDGDLPMEKFAGSAGTFCKRQQKIPLSSGP
jgi:hypothetical protein